MATEFLYAAFGSNLHPRRLKDRIPDAAPLGSAFLPDWKLHFHKRSDDTSGKCNITRSGGGVHVAVYRLDAVGKRRLDEIEGVGLGYEHGAVDVPEFGLCHTYFAAETHIDESLTTWDWYREMVLLGALWHGFPKRYIDEIVALETIRDPDPARSRKNWRTVERLRADTMPDPDR